MVRRRFPAAGAGPTYTGTRLVVCPRGEPTSSACANTAAGGVSVCRVGGHGHLALVVLGREPKGGAGGARCARRRGTRRTGGLSPHRAHPVAQLKAASRCRPRTATAETKAVRPYMRGKSVRHAQRDGAQRKSEL